MSIKKEERLKITELFNEAICSYNNIVELRKSDNKSLVEEFNSNLQYYSSIECAFRCVIEDIVGKKCPYYLHEMIEILIDDLNPNPLEEGIDLFYILRYKDTRNETVHNINICELNAYPKLFFNAYKFIRRYIDRNFEAIQWKEECNEFDYALFNQIFRKSIYDNVRVLVLPPVYNYQEKMEILGNYHWNIVLDFDPYSELYGIYSKTNFKNRKLIQLSQIEKYRSSDFSIEEVTWVMCDGDKMMNIKSFKPRKEQDVPTGKFIPSMMEGINNWTNCYNLEESTQNAKKLLSNFFQIYFEKMQYDVNVFFAMDYSARVYATIYDSIASNINMLMQGLDVHILNESLTVQLEKDILDYERWYVYDATLNSFLEKLEQNIPKEYEREKVYLLPCLFPSDGKLSERAYNHINQEFFMLHSKFPNRADEIRNNNLIQDDLKQFLRGELASWQLIKAGQIQMLDVGRSIRNKIVKAIDSGKSFYNLYHAAGFGGSTIARQIAYDLSKDYPVLFMKRYIRENLGNRISQIYNITHKKILIFVEEEIYDNVTVQKNECLKIAEATSAQVMFVFIARRPQTYTVRSSRDVYFICRYASSDVEKIIELNKNVLTMNSESRRLLNASADTFIRELGEDNICPFLINLSIYKDEFIKLDEYLHPFIEEIKTRPDLKRIFVYICIFTCFINKGIPLRFLCQKLSIKEDPDWNVLRDKYDPLIYVRHNLEFHISEVMVRAPYMAEHILKSIVGDGEEGILYRKQLNVYLIEMIKDIKAFYSNSIYAKKCLRQLFIDKGLAVNTEDEYSETIVDQDLTMIKKYFAPVIAKLWDKDEINLAGDIFESLIKNYPGDSYFYAHAARYYAYTGRDYPKAKEYYNKAIEYLQEKENAYSSKSDIYHVKGMCIREELFKNIERVPVDNDLLSTIDVAPFRNLYYEASTAYEVAYNTALNTDTKTIEYSYTAWLTLIIKTVLYKRLEILKEKEVEEEIQKALTIISNLEDIYILGDNFDDEDECRKKLDDIERKKETLYSLQKEFKDAIVQWNNYYDTQKNSGSYSNCMYACKQRYYLLEEKTNGFRNIDEKNRKRIKRLSDDCYQAMLHLNSDDLKFGDLKVFLSISVLSEFQIDSIMSKLSSLYQQSEKNLQILYYRYVLKFLKAYEGDKLALQECSAYMKECCEFSEKYPGKANIIDYFVEGNQMGKLLSRKRLLQINIVYRTQAYKANELKYVSGILKQQGMETSIIPFDRDGNLMTGIEVHANLKYNPDVEASDSGQKVKFKFGFSYDGLKAENMSIKYLDDEIQKEKGKFAMEIGDFVDFSFKRELYGKKSGDVIGIVGYVGINENCILHISQVSKKRISQDDFMKIVNVSKEKTIRVQLYDHNEKGWSATLKSQKIDFENLSL